MVCKEHGPICQPIKSQGLQTEILFAKGTVLEFWVMGEKLPHPALTDGIGQVVVCGFGLCQVWGCWCDLGPLCFPSKFSSLKWDGKGTHFLALLWEAGEGRFHNAGHRSGQSEHQFRRNCHQCAACAISRVLEGKGLLAHVLYGSAFRPSSVGHTLSRLWCPYRTSTQVCASTRTIMPPGNGKAHLWNVWFLSCYVWVT